MIRFYQSFGLCCIFLTLSTACTFQYRDEAMLGDNSPEMEMVNAEATRYEQAQKSMVFTAKFLEVYDADRVWAAESVRFVEYSEDGPETIDLEGSAGYLIIDDKEGINSLGNTTKFFMREDGMEVVASDLRWTKKLHSLQSPENGTVQITKNDGSSVRGTGFFADTLSRSYMFKRDFYGVIVNNPGNTDEMGTR